VPKFHIFTFGCKANQYDTQLWREFLLSAGLKGSNQADVFLINTCSVTAAAEAQARQLVRRLRQSHPRSRIILAGCYGVVAGQGLTRLPDVDLAIGGCSLENFAKLADFLECGRADFPRYITGFAGHTRAFIKVQDGCDHGCSYCIVPLARGRSRSRDLAEIVAEAQGLIASGYRELVLTGIRLGDYKPSLKLLVKSLASLPGLLRLRLSSLEPDDVDEELIEALVACPRVAKHLHLPLQSGSDRILKAMHRPYRLRDYAALLERIQRLLPEMTFGTDILVGFPGESEDDFSQSYGAVRDLPITHLHVFCYSRRPGTPAAAWEGQIPEAIKKERSHRLRQMFQAKQQRYWSGLIGRQGSVLFEAQRSGLWTGWEEHYFPVRVSSSQPLQNRLCKVRLVSVESGGLKGVLVG